MVSSMITNHLIKASIIEEKQRELYEYSIKSLFGNVLNIVSGLAIGVKNLQKGAGKAKARATIFSRSQAVTRLLPLRDNG